MNKKIIALSVLSLMALPGLVFAIAIPDQPGDTLSVTGFIDGVFNFIWPIFAGVAIIMFIISGFMFILARGDATKLSVARQSVLWGIIGVALAIISFSIPWVIYHGLGFN